MLQEEHDEHVERRQANAPDQRQAEQQVERDRRANHFRQIARRDGDFTQQPEDINGRARVAVAAGLGQVAAAGDAEARRQRLEQDRHQVGNHDHAEQRVAVLGAAGQVGCPISGIHVADGNQKPGPANAKSFRNQVANAARAWCCALRANLAAERHGARLVRRSCEFDAI